MTPNNIAVMAALAGLQIVALTDHNSCRNCPAFFEAAKKAGIIPVAGMELTTAEDIHIVCLFEHLEDALRFNDAVDERRIRIPNRTDIFGDQLILDRIFDKVGFNQIKDVLRRDNALVGYTAD
jgi:predicted metal-dependent phosphoesterase TrpH